MNSTLEQMIADKAAESINNVLNSLVAEATATLEKERKYIQKMDDVAYPAHMIADLVGVSYSAIQLWFENGKLTNVAQGKERKKAKFKEFKHLIKRED